MNRAEEPRLGTIGLVAVLCAWAIAGCGSRATTSTKPSPIPDPGSGRGDTSTGDTDCEARQQAVYAAAARSRARHCDANRECVLVPGPRSLAHDASLVVNRVDAPLIESEALAVIELCGESAFYDPQAGYIEVSGRCSENHCVVEESSVSPLWE